MDPALAARAPILDLIRAASAVVVMCGHLRNALLPDFENLVSPGLALKVFYLVSGMGHQAVIVFFVLSGYLVGGSVIRAGANFSWSHYAIIRLSRLWTVLVPAILLTALLDGLLLTISPQILGSPHLASWHSMPSQADYAGSMGTAIQNIFFLQTITAPTFGTNGPLWSLANEAWYYLLFPCLFTLSTGRLRPGQKGLAVLIALAALWAMPGPMRGLFLVWLLGATLHLIRAPSFVKRHAFGWGSFVVFLGVLCAARLARLPLPNLLLPEYALGLSLAVWCAHLHATMKQPSKLPLRRVSHVLSEMSFSLYVIHMPMVFVLVGGLFPKGKVAADASGMALFFGLSLLIVALSWAFWWVFERNTALVRRQLQAWLIRPAGKSSAA